MSHKNIFRIWLVMLISIFGSSYGTTAQNDGDAQPDLVVIAGTIQSVLGCEGNWQPECEVTALSYNEEHDLWSAEFDLPAGEYEYKVALDGSWTVNYGLNAAQDGGNIPLVLEEDTTVRFFYSPTTHWVSDNVNSILANVPGSYQSEIGCAEDWAPWCLRTLLQDPDGDGIYTYTTTTIPEGFYEAKVAFNETWSLNYGDNGAQNGPNIGFSVPENDSETVFSFDTATNIMTITVGGESGPATGSLFTSRGLWLTRDTLAWNIGRVPGAVYRLHYSPTAELDLTAEGIEGGESIILEYDRSGFSEELLTQHPYLSDYFALKISEGDLALVPDILLGQTALSVRFNNDTVLGDATGVQAAVVLDDLYANDDPLGVTWENDIPTISVWAPTAQNVRFHLFADTEETSEATLFDMTRNDETGNWSITGEADWRNQYYLYEVTVYAPTERAIVTNLVTDPYSFSLSMNSTRSQIVDLSDPSLMPDGWLETLKPKLDAPEDIVIYELHVRDFSIQDESVSALNRGTFMAFTETESNGMQHLQALANAGLTHIHLLPVFDIASINENADERQEADRDVLLALPSDSEEQQALIDAVRSVDGFNWGYDPYHYTTPEGSYATNPTGIQRIIEFRAMVQALNQAGLRVVMDVVYNHTSDAGQSSRSVLDRIVPGYYHRLNSEGRIETSTCCQNTASEHVMMERLLIDSVLTWATAYRVDGFRFDLMGHHMLENMVALREAVDNLTVETDGVDGQAIYIYGEGWDFGEVLGNARGVNAAIGNMAGTGIGTFSDRLRDGVRGGTPFSGIQEQGFINGLFTNPNDAETRDADTQLADLLHSTDWIRIGLAGNLANYPLIDSTGASVIGAQVDYNNQPAGYTADPQENIVYVSAHDNETLFDVIQVKSPLLTSIDDRVRMQNLGLSIVAFSQGVPFFHAGDDILRSKSLDRNSYDSGDWYNAIDWTYQSNNWGRGLPPAWDNQDNWEIQQPLLANPDLVVTNTQITRAMEHFREILQIRSSSLLFRLRTEQDVIDRVVFYNTGTEQTPGLIVMSLSDLVGEDLDPNYDRIMVIFNATTETVSTHVEDAVGQAFELHPVFTNSTDAVVTTSSVDTATGTFTVPALTSAVFVVPQNAS